MLPFTTRTPRAGRPAGAPGRRWLRAGIRRAREWRPECVTTWRRRLAATHIGARLAGIVLLTGGLTFAVVGGLAVLRLQSDAVEQAGALTQLSRQQVARRLDGEARLAEARLNLLFQEAERQTRYLAQRLDIVKAIGSVNHVAIQELLAPAAITGELDSLLVVDASGAVTGASRATDLLAASEALAGLGLGQEQLKSVFADNLRSRRRAHAGTYRVPDGYRAATGLPPGRNIAHVAIEPVFDDFGDVISALVGMRALAASERTFEHFSALAHAGVVIFDGDRIISAGGDPVTGLRPRPALPDDVLVKSPDGTRVARCIAGALSLTVCVHTDAAEVRAAREEMQRISARQARSLLGWFTVLAAGSLSVLVAVVLVSVRRVTRGLPQLATAAAAVARGDLDIPFQATGLGEVRSLGRAFEAMLANLRENVGRIRQLAFFDPVTGLANRERMRLDGTSALASGTQPIAFLFIDLDRFKAVNDTFGHKAGDALLRLLAKRMKPFFEERKRAGALDEFWAGRVGGDEFLVIVRSRLDAEGLRACAQGLIDVLSETYVVGSAHLSVGASIGIAVADRSDVGYDDLLINADIAMYEAKRQGRNSCAFFTAEAAAMVQERLAIERDLRVALKQRSLDVHYQPKVSLMDGQIVGAEALVRWHHPSRGHLPPGKFIGVAEEAGLIPELGLFVLRRAIQEVGPMIARGVDVTVAVNVSVLQLEDPTFAQAVEESLSAAGFPARGLELEITESVAMRASDVVQNQMARLRAVGVRFSIDDFGTGYSNLAMLARLQVDTLKIDRTLVHGVQDSAEKQSIVRSILSLAKSLGFETVVEGVETEEDLRFVTVLGADLAQGFHFSPAVPIRTFEAFVDPHRGSVLLGRDKPAA